MVVEEARPIRIDALRTPRALPVPGYESDTLWLWLWLSPLTLNPVMGRRVGGEKARRVAGRTPASSLTAQGRAVSEPRSPLAQSDGFFVRPTHPGRVLLVTFLARLQEK